MLWHTFPQVFYEIETENVLYDNYMESIQKLRNIHHASTKLIPSNRKAVSGVLCRKKEDVYKTLTIDIGSYYSDLPEQKDMLGVKHSNLLMNRVLDVM